MKTEDFDYYLPKELIAQTPLAKKKQLYIVKYQIV